MRQIVGTKPKYAEFLGRTSSNDQETRSMAQQAGYLITIKGPGEQIMALATNKGNRKMKNDIQLLKYIASTCTAERRQPTEIERQMARDASEHLDAEQIPEFWTRSQQQPLKPGLGGDYQARITGGGTGEFRSLGEQALAVMRASCPGGEVDPRLGKYRAAAGANEGIPSDGGFLLQDQFSYDLLTRSYDAAPLAARCKRVTIGPNSNTLKLPAIDETSRATGSRLGGVRAFWVGEGVQGTASKPKFRTIELSLKKLMGLCYATDELLQDSAMLEVILRDGFSSEIGFMLDDGILNGTGAGQLLGVLQGPCLVTVPIEAGQLAKTVQYENILALWTRMPARNRKNAVWVINQDIEPQLYTMGLIVGMGGSPVFMPGGGISGSPYATIFGRPIVPVEQASTLGTVGDIILADFQEYILIDKAGGIDFQSSMHLRFDFYEQVFRIVYRCDGQPIPNSAVTPFKGSATVSPFVTLAAR